MNTEQKYPLLLKPVIKDYLWGGTRLKTEFGFETDKEIAAEGWMLSCHKDGTNTVENGAYAGKSLDEVLKHWGYEEKFPILIKLIDAKDRLLEFCENTDIEIPELSEPVLECKRFGTWSDIVTANVF